MTDLHRPQVQSIVDWAHALARLAAPHDPGAQGSIDRVIDQLRQDRIQLTVIGKTNSGKSTLINALLGRSDDLVAPIDRLPASSTVSKFRRAAAESATIVFRDGRRERVGFADVRRYVTEEENPGNRRDVDVVEIAGPFANLPAELELIDTPGAGSLHEYHDALLLDFLPASDAAIFLISARMPLDREELALLKRVRQAEIGKIFFAVNRIDEVTAEELNDALEHNRRLLASIGVYPDDIHLLSAKRAHQGERDSSGLQQLTGAIGQFLAQGRSEILQRQMTIRVAQLIAPTLTSLELQLSTWNQSDIELEASRRQLQQRERTIAQEQELVEREFQLSWDRAVDAYEEGLRRARAETLAALETLIGDAALSDVSALARRLPTEVARVQEEQMREPAAAFEDAARRACAKLQADCPQLRLDGSEVINRSRDSSEVALGLAGGASLAAAGTSLAMAGSAASATIVAANSAALAATTTVSAPSLVASLLTMAGLPELATLATGTATVAAPAAITTTPLWVALSGPVGWTLAGIGVLAVPFSWRLSKLRQRDQLADAARRHVESTYELFATQRLPALRRMGSQIAAEAQLRVDRQLSDARRALGDAQSARVDGGRVAELEQTVGTLRSLLLDHPLAGKNADREGR